MRLKGVWLEPMTFREKFWLCLRVHAAVAITLVPAELNIHSSHMKMIHLAIKFPRHQTLLQ